jgi:hypothetical protein
MRTVYAHSGRAWVLRTETALEMRQVGVSTCETAGGFFDRSWGTDLSDRREPMSRVLRARRNANNPS